MRRIAVLTSGGDAPGMNAAIRSVRANRPGQRVGSLQAHVTGMQASSQVTLFRCRPEM